MRKKKKISIVGTNGIPASYGGYETLANQLVNHLNRRFDFVVYCSKSQPKSDNKYNNVRLIRIPLNANGWQSLIYDSLTLLHAVIISDVILYLGPSAGFLVPFLKIFKKKIIVNHGGLNEWERKKYTSFQKFIAKIGHKYSSQFADVNIADNELLRNSIKTTFSVDSKVIRYGGDHAKKNESTKSLKLKYPFIEKNYYVNVSRAQVDNNLHVVLDSFKNCPDKNLVMISNWGISDYGLNLKYDFFNNYENITILDAIYDIEELNAIRGNAIAYIHSHSYCGTAPSLVEAMSLGLPIFSFNVATNKETTKSKAFFFSDSKELTDLIDNESSLNLRSNGITMKRIAEENYTWKFICQQYSEIF